jgi:predicted phosphodiesterase
MNFILTADWHLRSQRPRCRLDDDWLDSQRKALDQIADHAREVYADVVCVGDIFHSTNETTNEIITMVQDFAKTLMAQGQKLYILAGNHDLPAHNLDNINRSAFNVLLNSVNIYHISDNHLSMDYSAENFGAETQNEPLIFKHILCFPEKAPIPPGAEAVHPSDLFGQYDKAKYICTGDYHHSFIYKKGSKRLFNPGCLLRQAADLINYQPSIMYIRDVDGVLEAERLLIKDDHELVTDEYLNRQEEREGRIDAFIERIKSNGEVTFDFIENVKNRLLDKKIEGGVKRMVLNLIEES